MARISSRFAGCAALLATAGAFGLLSGCAKAPPAVPTLARKAGFVRVVNLTGARLPAAIDDQTIGAGLAPEGASQFYRKRVGSVRVAAAGQVINVSVADGVGHTVYVLGKPDEPTLSVLSGDDKRAKSSLRCVVRFVNLSGRPTMELRVADLSGREGLRLVATQGDGASGDLLGPMSCRLSSFSAGRALAYADLELRPGKAYTAVAYASAQGKIALAAFDNDPEMSLGATGVSVGG
jgi:hypothetical protein